MHLRIELRDEFVYMFVEEPGRPARPLFAPGETPAWAGGWAGGDGLGGYGVDDAVGVLVAFGAARDRAEALLAPMRSVLGL